MSTQNCVRAHNIDLHSVVIFAFALLSAQLQMFTTIEKRREKNTTLRGGLKRIKLITKNVHDSSLCGNNNTNNIWDCFSGILKAVPLFGVCAPLFCAHSFF